MAEFDAYRTIVLCRDAPIVVGFEELSGGVYALKVSLADGVGGLTKNIDVTPNLSVGGSYVTGDFVGTSGVPMEFALAGRENGSTGWVLGALLENNVAESIAMELWLFDATVTPPADSAAWTISDADAKKCIGVLKFAAADWCLSALNGVVRTAPAAIPFTCAPTSQSLYGCLVARGTLTGAVTVRLNIAQD